MTADWKKYFDPKILQCLIGHRFRSRGLLGGTFAGTHRSQQAGQAIEFSQHREYSPGDDVRQIDWKIYGRTDKYYVRQHEDETNLCCYLILDCSESMTFQGQAADCSKLEYAMQLAGAFAFVVTENQDAVALTMVHREKLSFVPPSAQRGVLSVIGEAFMQCEGAGKTDLGNVMQVFADKNPRRGCVVLISDLLDDRDRIASGLRRLKHDGHEVSVLHVIDRDEKEFPFNSPSRFVGLEMAGDLEVDGYGIRNAYLAEFESFITDIQQVCRGHGFDYEQFVTDEPLTAALPQYLAKRE